MTSTRISLLSAMKTLKPLNVENTKSLMLHLGVKINDLDDIQFTHRDANNKKMHLIQKWLEIDVDASWERLVAALREIDMHTFAVEIELNHSEVKALVPIHHSCDPVISSAASSSLVVSGEETIIEKVKEKIEYLEDDFFKLKSDTRASLSDRERQDRNFLEMFCDFLLDLPVAKRVIHVKFFRESEDEILEAKNIRKVFAILGRYCNYSNYEIIVHVIKKFGSVELKARMLKYCDSIKKFEVSTIVAIYLKAISAHPGGEICKRFDRMAVKINKSINECTLHEIRQLKEAIAENASVHSYSMYIESVAESSVLVVLRVHSACTKQVYAAMTPDFTYLYNLKDIKTESAAPSSYKSLLGSEESEAEEDLHELEAHSPPSTPPLPPRSDSSSLKSEEKRAKHDRQENLEDEQKSFSPPSPAVDMDEKKTVTTATFGIVRCIATGPRQQVPPDNVRTTEDDDGTGDSGMGTGSGDPWDVRSFLFRRNVRMTDNDDETADMRTDVPSRPIRRIRGGRTDVSSDNGVYAPLNADEVTVNTYTSPFHPNRRLGASNPTMETYLNRSVLMEVVKVLESSKVQERRLAQQVRAMLFQTEVDEPFLTIQCGKYKTVDVDRKDAERLLGNDDCSEGTFLIRDGHNARCEMVLSVRLVEKEVGHFRIHKDKDSRYFFEGMRKFESLDELIDNYKEQGDVRITHNKRDFKLLGSPLHI